MTYFMFFLLFFLREGVCEVRIDLFDIFKEKGKTKNDRIKKREWDHKM